MRKRGEKINLRLVGKKCDFCGKRIKEAPVEIYFRTFCSKEHAGNYFGDYVEESWDEAYWSDFY